MFIFSGCVVLPKAKNWWRRIFDLGPQNFTKIFWKRSKFWTFLLFELGPWKFIGLHQFLGPEFISVKKIYFWDPCLVPLAPERSNLRLIVTSWFECGTLWLFPGYWMLPLSQVWGVPDRCVPLPSDAAIIWRGVPGWSSKQANQW